MQNLTEKFKVKRLTTEEIESLQVDSALRALGENMNILLNVNEELIARMQDKLIADADVQQLKEIKRTIINTNKTLATIARNS